jgi:hypothetical protein
MARFKKPVHPPFGIQPTPARRDGPSPCVTGVAAFRNGGIRDDSGGGGGPVGGLYITDGASECQGQAVHFFTRACMRACNARTARICTLAGF